MTAPHQWKVRVLSLTLTGENVKLAPRSQIFLTGGGPRLGAWSCCLSARHSRHGRLRLRCDLRHPALSITSILPVYCELVQMLYFAILELQNDIMICISVRKVI